MNHLHPDHNTQADDHINACLQRLRTAQIVPPPPPPRPPWSEPNDPIILLIYSGNCVVDSYFATDEEMFRDILRDWAYDQAMDMEKFDSLVSIDDILDWVKAESGCMEEWADIIYPNCSNAYRPVHFKE